MEDPNKYFLFHIFLKIQIIWEVVKKLIRINISSIRASEYMQFENYFNALKLSTTTLCLLCFNLFFHKRKKMQGKDYYKDYK